MEVGKTGLLVRVIVALVMILLVIVLPESLIDNTLSILTALLFFGMAAAIVIPWRKPDLLGWELFGLFTTLGIVFTRVVLVQHGWASVMPSDVYRTGIRAVIVICELGVFAGLIRVNNLQWRNIHDTSVLHRLDQVEKGLAVEVGRNDAVENAALEAIHRADVEQAVQDARISAIEDERP